MAKTTSPIDSYCQQFPKEIRILLEEMKKIIKSVAQNTDEIISYGIPTFDLQGKHLVHFAGFKNHLGFFPTPSAIEAFKDELQAYKTSKGTIQFPYKQPIPRDLIKKIVEYRVQEVSPKKTRYIALLRGINVGGNKKVSMKELKALFEKLGYTKVSTYINSGNIFFEADENTETLRITIEKHLQKTFGFSITTLVKTQEEIQKIIQHIPSDRQNNETEKSDVAFLFPEIDKKTIISELPLKKEYVDIRYTPGALYRNIKRDAYNKSQINKLVVHPLYQYMTIRNCNTARYLANNL